MTVASCKPHVVHACHCFHHLNVPGAATTIYTLPTLLQKAKSSVVEALKLLYSANVSLPVYKRVPTAAIHPGSPLWFLPTDQWRRLSAGRPVVHAWTERQSFVTWQSFVAGEGGRAWCLTLNWMKRAKKGSFHCHRHLKRQNNNYHYYYYLIFPCHKVFFLSFSREK